MTIDGYFVCVLCFKRFLLKQDILLHWLSHNLSDLKWLGVHPGLLRRELFGAKEPANPQKQEHKKGEELSLISPEHQEPNFVSSRHQTRVLSTMDTGVQAEIESTLPQEAIVVNAKYSLFLNERYNL